MNILTDLERSAIRKDVFQQNRADVEFVKDAMDVYRDWHKWFVEGEALELSHAIDESVRKYCERCGLFAEAEQNLIESKGINGKRWLEA